jgi:pyrimidine deaminase RibD-like protein
MAIAKAPRGKKPLTTLESKEPHMRAAIKLALKGVADGKGGPFGAVIVRSGRVIARGPRRDRGHPRGVPEAQAL